MRLITEQFMTRQEAQAFIQGIELVHNPDLAAHEAVQQGARWTVYVHAWRGTVADVCPLCGAGNHTQRA